MPRLPISGSDSNTWGDILNDFLAQAHNSDGTIKDIGVIAAKAEDNEVVHDTGNETIAGIKTFNSSPLVPTPTTGTQAANKTYVDLVASSAAPDATTTTKGIVQLAGDLSGTAVAPTVPALATKADASALATHTSDTSNPHSVTKAQVGLDNVDNTSDANKPVSTATQTALNAKAQLASPTFTGIVTVPDNSFSVAKLSFDPATQAELDLKAPLFLTANTQAGSYVLVLGDVGKVIEMNVAGANTLTVPPNSSVAFPIGTIVEVYQMGAGQTTLTPGAGVTLREREGKLKTAGQYATVALRKRATDEWVVAGDVTA
jgi:uncharacterized protein DUF5907/baseplate protein BppL